RRAVGRCAGGPDGRLRDADRGDRAVDDLSRRLRADGAGRSARRAGPVDGRGLRPAGAHRGGVVRLALPRGAGSGGLGRSPAGGLGTEVLGERITRASAFVTDWVEEAAALGRWIEGELPKMREWLAGLDTEWVSRYAKLREVETYVAGPICHVMWAFTTGDAC